MEEILGYLFAFSAVVAFMFGTFHFDAISKRNDCVGKRTAIIQTSNQVDKANAYYYDCMEGKR